MFIAEDQPALIFAQMPLLPNSQHELFAQALAQGQSASAAYVSAGFKPHASNASRLSRNDKVQARIAEILEAGALAAGVTVQRIVEELAKIGFSDIRRAVKWQSDLVTEEDNPDGGDVLVIKQIVTNRVQIVPSDELDDATAACLSEVSQTKEGALKIKFYDKLGALEKLGKHLGMFVEQSEVKVVHDISAEPLTLDEWEANTAIPDTAH